MGRSFDTTQWSLVLQARDGDPSEVRAAMSRLCEAYFEPVYGFIRRQTRDPESARDLAQGFFVQLLGDGFLRGLRPEVGRFRSFLLGAVRHYMSDEWDRERALKRGGGAVAISLDAQAEERALRFEPATTQTAEQVFEQRWAATVLVRALARLEREMDAGHKEAEFREMRPFLTDLDPGRSHRELAEVLGSTEGAVKVAIHRLRKRFGQCLRAEIAETVNDPADVEQEIRYLLSVV